MTVIGLDFGTSYSTVARPSEGNDVVVVPNHYGDVKTPSVVFYDDSDVLVGGQAIEAAAAVAGDPALEGRLVRSVKRNLITPPLIALPDMPPVTPLQVVSTIFGKLREDASADGKDAPTKAVITYPAAFDTAHTAALLHAAASAGFQEVELLEEPVAAATAFGHEGGHIGNGVLVYDFGGGTFDAAFVARDPGEERFYLAFDPEGDLTCGGDDIDQLLYEHFDGLARDRLGRGLTAVEGQMSKSFLRSCQRRKETLATSRMTSFSLRLDDGQVFDATLDRETLVRLMTPLVERSLDITGRMVAEARDAGFAVDTILLVGGSSQLPTIRPRVEALTGISPQSWGRRDVAVALGAAHHARMLWRPKVARGHGSESERYRRAISMLWSDSRLDESEFQRLMRLRDELDIPRESAEALELEVLGTTAKELRTTPKAFESATPDVATDASQQQRSDEQPSQTAAKQSLSSLAIAMTRADDYRERGLLSRAVEQYSEALHIDANYVAAYVSRGAVRLACHEYELALTDFMHAIDMGDAGFEAHIGKAQALAELYRTQEGLDELDLILRSEAGRTALAPLLVGAKLLSRSDQIAPAYDYVRAALNMSPNNADVLLARASVRARFDPEGAIADLERVLESKPECAKAMAGLILLKADENNIDATLLEKAVATDPRDPLVKLACIYGIICARCSNYRIALPENLSERAHAELPAGSGDVWKEFEQLHREHPYFIPAIEMQAEVASEEGQAVLALAMVDAALVRLPHKASLHLCRADALVHLNRVQEACESISHILANSDDPDVTAWALTALATVKVSADAPGEEVTALVDKALAQKERPDALFIRAIIRAASGQPDWAESDFKRAAVLSSGPMVKMCEVTGNCLLLLHAVSGTPGLNVLKEAIDSAPLENGWKAGQREELVSAMKHDAGLPLWLARCSRQLDFLRQTAILFTTERIYWCRATVFGAPQSGMVEYKDVTRVIWDPLVGQTTLIIGADAGFKEIRGGSQPTSPSIPSFAMPFTDSHVPVLVRSLGGAKGQLVPGEFDARRALE